LWKFRATRGRAWFFAFCYFTLSLIPALGIMRMSFMYFSRVADHLQYLALLGIIPLVVAGLARLVSSVTKNSTPQKNQASVFVGAIVVLVFSVLTWQQAGNYKDEQVLWENTIKQNPNTWIAYNRLGDLLVNQNKFQEAADNYKKSINLKPNHSRTHN